MPTSDAAYTSEIGIVEFLSVLSDGKWWILGITAAALAGAFSWLALTEPSYESEAIITAPSLADYNNLYPGFLADQAPEPDEVLGEVMNYMASPNQQRAFLAKNIEPEAQEEEALKRALEALEVTENQSGDLQSASINLRYTSADAGQARAIVDGFTEKTNEDVINQLARNAKSQITKRVTSLAEQVDTQKSAHKKNLKQQIAQLEAAEKRAHAHGIKTNQHSKSSSLVISNRLKALDSDNGAIETGATTVNTSILREPLFEYGTRALSALMENRQQQLDQLPPETVQVQSRKESWENLDIKTENSAALSIYQSATEAEPTRSSPLVITAAGVLGLMLGGIAVLFRHAWRNAVQ